MPGTLQGKKGLIVGVADERSIAWGCAQAFYDEGAALTLTYLNDKAKPHVAMLADKVKAPLLPLDVRDDAQLDAVFYDIKQRWGKLDFLLHSIAFAPKKDLQGKFSDCSRDGFLEAIDISCYSFVAMARHAAQLMKKGGSLLAVSYYGGEKVVPHYGLMGPVKAALEASARTLACELGSSGIRVNILSPGPIATRAAGGIAGFGELLDDARDKSPQHEIVTIESVGAYARFLVSDEAKHVTGSTVYIDAGYHILGN